MYNGYFQLYSVYDYFPLLLACDEGKYKFTQGNEECTECPANSNSTSPGAVSCECISGYYRASNENVTVDCTGIK